MPKAKKKKKDADDEALFSILECPICYRVPGGRKIYQCCNGHHICEQCLERLPLKNCQVICLKEVKNRVTYCSQKP